MTIQLDLAFADYDQPNRVGVYVDCEVMAMQVQKKGSIRAEVRVAFTPSGFCWGSSATLENEGFGVLPSARDIPAGRVVTTKAEAIGRACEDIRRRVGHVDTNGARCVLQWVDEVQRGAA